MKKPTKCFLIPDDPKKRQGTLDEWTAWDGPAVLAGNARSGGVGLNMTAAHIAIFLSNDYRMEDRAQAEDRIHRIGSEVHSSITIVDIVVSDSVEQDVLRSLKEKIDVVTCFLERIRKKSGYRRKE